MAKELAQALQILINQNKVDNAVKVLEQGASHKPTSKSFTLGSACNIVYS